MNILTVPLKYIFVFLLTFQSKKLSISKVICAILSSRLCVRLVLTFDFLLGSDLVDYEQRHQVHAARRAAPGGGGDGHPQGVELTVQLLLRKELLKAKN